MGQTGQAATLTVVVAGPAPDVVGGMATVTNTLASSLVGDDSMRVVLLDSGGGRGPRGYWRFPLALARIARSDYSVLHLQVASGGSTLRKALMARLARRRGLPYVVHLHGAVYADFLAELRPRRRAAVRELFTEAAGVIVLGDAWHDLLVAELGVPTRDITVVHNGVDPVPRVPDADKPAPRSIVFVGEVSQRKGADVLLQAWQDLTVAGRASGWQLLLLGPTPDAWVAQSADELASRTEGLQLCGSVTGPGKDALVSAASLFCLPSRAEGLPMALLEGFSAGLPAVTTPVGSIPQVVGDHNGRLVPPGDAAALASALDELMHDDAERARLSDGALETYRGRFTSDHMAQQVARVWRAAAGVPRG